MLAGRKHLAGVPLTQALDPMNQSSSPSPTKALIDTLGSAAMYNDKGYSWNGHTMEQSEIQQGQFQTRLLELVAEIGESNFSQELLSAIRSGAAARDASGEYKTMAVQLFGASDRL